MRLRNVRGSREEIAQNEYVVQDSEQYKGKWNEFFQNDNPIHIEIGMGKGKFICCLAGENPGINYLGIEKYSSVLIRGIEKRKELFLPNLYFVRLDAEYINDVFDKEEVDRIYLNFSDPWPKDRHAKRRLTSKEFLARYEKLLKKNGEVIFKTDNRELFDFSLEEAEIAGWEIKNYTYDLHNSEYMEGNVMTEYEEKFSALGNPIHRMVIQQKKQN
ncbi:tRNA (guanosine(46)-N7)-methyltransferase TrmB [Anaerocolumna xylanovorans]|uniref:tRNA (guanine-N(7)-)-methyltransferase n=1 Tax=Anaerocolumna xylanovorans DSM 12503 TaxID=1121345 RepID=A0A1M7YNK4_9FIRM|nr:tRNA (guanosine(46)-N7)-methyltransferase TrmB [Anaerocolumna xylanovorans]SHO54244.1 tRNA (guanine-N(7)-)-methyltransferase [Anaerocolumna xylanovorans DSM 12503]